MAREGKARALDSTEFNRALKAAALLKYPKRNVALLCCSFYLALRACELRRLRLCDVLEADSLTLVNEVNLLKTMTKFKKQRHVYLTNKKCRKALEEYIQERREKAESKKRALDLSEPLFPSQKGGFFKDNTLVMLFRRIYDLAGLVGAKSHSGRRSFITRHIELGTDIKALQTMAGHENINTTAGYAECNPFRLQRIAEKQIF